MQLRNKVVLLAVVPLVLAAGLLAFVFRGENRALAEAQIDEIDELLARDELHNLVDLARGTIPDLDSVEHNDRPTQEHALELLRQLNFGKNGYFYIYDMDGNNLMHPWWKELENHNQWNLTDDRGHQPIQELTKVARDGGAAGGFLRYRWPRPPQQSAGRWSDKLGYVVWLPHWNWMLGTGIYLDDIKAIKETPRRIQSSSAAAVGRTMRWIAVIAVLAVLVAASVGVALNVSQQRLADAKLRRLTWQLVAAEEQERARVARYLHDEAMQDLVAVNVILETLLIELNRQPGRDKLCTMVEQGLRGLAQSVDQIRELSHGLRPRLLGEGLPALLAQTGAAFSERTGVPTAVDAPSGLQPMSAEAATALFRVTQQALDNIGRHAHATRVGIRLASRERRGASGISLTVTDDGCGFDTAAVERRSGGGIGLLNMRERIEALGGRLFILSRSNGTEIEAFLPNEAPREGDAHDSSDSSDSHSEAT